MRTTIAVLLLLATPVAADEWIAAAPSQRLGTWAVEADQHDPNVIYADGSENHLWKTVDGGATWNATSLSVPNFLSASVIVETGRPSAVTAVYSSGGDYFVSRSVNGGVTWTTRTFKSPISGLPAGVAVDSQNPDVLYASLSRFCVFSCYRGGVIKSTNGGRNWSTLLADLEAREIFSDPVTSSLLYVNTSKGLLRSMDGGVTWGTIVASPTGAFAVDRKSGKTLYVIGDSVLRSEDRGETWKSMVTSPPQSWFAFGGAVNPNDPNDVSVTRGSGGVYRSRDGGARWGKIPLADPLNPGYIASVYQLSFTANGILWAASGNAKLHFLDTTVRPPPVIEEPRTTVPPPLPPGGPLPPLPTPRRRAVGH